MADTADVRRQYLLAAGALIVIGLIGYGVVDYTKTFYPGDFRAMLEANPDQNMFVIEQYLKGEINVLTRTTGNEYQRYRLNRDDMCAYESASKLGCYSFKIYYKPLDHIRDRYGYDEYVYLMRKASKISIGSERIGETVIITKQTPLYAYNSKSGSDGFIIEKIVVTQLGAEYSVEYAPGMATRTHKLDLIVTDIRDKGRLPIGFSDDTEACFGNAPDTFCLEWRGMQDAFLNHDYDGQKLIIHFRDFIGTIKLGA